ncbi:MAG: DUF6308 family protein [Armatimonadetes bacterium]|nr:DUF6308 family protein [Armatimonadota bacterium]
MSDEIELVGSRGRLTVRDCLAKLRHFCEHDAYQVYDRAGYHCATEPNELQAELLDATNRAMFARSSRAAWSEFLGRTLSELEATPVDVDLVDSGDDEYATARAALEACYRRLTAVKRITDMAASKMLHLKRPLLVAISDSYVREVLAIPEPDSAQHPWRVEYCTVRALCVSDAVRAVGLHNVDLLEHLQSAMAETVDRIAADLRTPMSLSKARIIDILVWVDAAIASGHKTWKPVADAVGWDSVLVSIRRPRN